MEQDALKSAWQGMNAESKSNTELQSMLHERRHPVLKRIRQQLVIETVYFAVFLFVYYDFFDGDRKPLYANILLVAAALLVVVHNITGYILTKRRIKGNDLKQSLNHHYFKMKVYAVISVASRLLLAVCLLLFFTSVIEFDARKYWILTGGIVFFIIQIIFLSRIWMGRINQMKGIIHNFSI